MEDNNNNNQTDSHKIDLLIRHAIETNHRLDSIDQNLAEHMRRSVALEVRQEMIEEEVKPILTEIKPILISYHSEIKPLLKNFAGFTWALRALLALATLAELYNLIKH